jgi:anti-sigma factor RsiW
MGCESWAKKLDAYLDGELSPDDARALDEHLRECAACAARSFSELQLKRAVQTAGRRYVPDPVFRARIEKRVSARRTSRWVGLWLPVLSGAVALLIAAVIMFSLSRKRQADEQVLGELTDIHVATLASSNPVDVVSTDRHTVKPWFEGKIPFTFNLPDLQTSPFVLVGGKVTYLNQSPGAELIFRVRQHQISVFIFQEQALAGVHVEPAQTVRSFTVRAWSHNGLRYLLIGDVAEADLDRLSELLKNAG